MTSRTGQDCTPIFLLKDSSAPLWILVLPTDRRSNAFPSIKLPGWPDATIPGAVTLSLSHAPATKLAR